MADGKKKCSVQGKIKCIFQTITVAAASSKRSSQNYRVIASGNLSSEFKDAVDLYGDEIFATEKVDGTCCLIKEFRSRPWLWARHDVKPNRAADKRFKEYQRIKHEQELNGEVSQLEAFVWNLEEDFKEKPDDWIPAGEVAEGENPIPGDNGHLVGWVPIDTSLRMHLWHLNVVDLNLGIGVFLHYSSDYSNLKICVGKLEDYIGKTLELVGSNINANPYGIGSKKNPVHFLIPHGELPVLNSPPFVHEDYKRWFSDERDGMMEGIVWHCPDGKMYKLHRCHVDVKWPIKQPLQPVLSTRSVTIDASLCEEIEGMLKNGLFTRLLEINGTTFEQLSDVLKVLDEKG